MARCPLTPSPFWPLVYLVFKTIFNLLTRDDQVCCFENAAQHLNDDGVFVVEAGVPRALGRVAAGAFTAASARHISVYRRRVQEE